MAKKTVKFNQKGASKLPNEKPVVYKIKTAGGKINYVGVAKRGRVQERINAHLNAGIIPGVKVQIEQLPTIQDAFKKEKNIISRTKPKYNQRAVVSFFKPDSFSKAEAHNAVKNMTVRK